MPLQTIQTSEYSDLAVAVEGVVHKAESGYQFAEIIFRPSLKIAPRRDREFAEALLRNTERLCLVARALYVPQKMETSIEVEEFVSVN